MDDQEKAFEAVIGLEIHAELETQSKMFCGCPVLDVTEALPNSAVCPICAGMPGTLPVINQRAVEYALRVAIALECEISSMSVFARKNYFYPDLPKGYQISQYEQPLAVGGRLKIKTEQGLREVRIRRVHLEEDTGKLTHIEEKDQHYSLIDLNRAGVPLLEIVSEPDMHSVEDVRAYASGLRSILRYLGVNSGDMQKGVLRIEPNVSVRVFGTNDLGTRSEIKNLNSFRALERSVAYEIERQSHLIQSGQEVVQETRGWDDAAGITVTQRIKEEADDYRYFPEPDLPPLVIDPTWLESIRSEVPELPMRRYQRFQEVYQLGEHDAELLIQEKAIADFFEQVLRLTPEISPTLISHWITGELFSLINQANEQIGTIKISPEDFSGLMKLISDGIINHPSAKTILTEMFKTGISADQIVTQRGLSQISDEGELNKLVNQVLESHSDQVKEYLRGKEAISQWLFGQVMRLAGRRANPTIMRTILDDKLSQLKEKFK